MQDYFRFLGTSLRDTLFWWFSHMRIQPRTCGILYFYTFNLWKIIFGFRDFTARCVHDSILLIYAYTVHDLRDSFFFYTFNLCKIIFGFWFFTARCVISMLLTYAYTIQEFRDSLFFILLTYARLFFCFLGTSLRDTLFRCFSHMRIQTRTFGILSFFILLTYARLVLFSRNFTAWCVISMLLTHAYTVQELRNCGILFFFFFFLLNICKIIFVFSDFHCEIRARTLCRCFSPIRIQSWTCGILYFLYFKLMQDYLCFSVLHCDKRYFDAFHLCVQSRNCGILYFHTFNLCKIIFAFRYFTARYVISMLFTYAFRPETASYVNSMLRW